jgi:hypothetical protein
MRPFVLSSLLLNLASSEARSRARSCIWILVMVAKRSVSAALALRLAAAQQALLFRRLPSGLGASVALCDCRQTWTRGKIRVHARSELCVHAEMSRSDRLSVYTSLSRS